VAISSALSAVFNLKQQQWVKSSHNISCQHILQHFCCKNEATTAAAGATQSDKLRWQ